MDSVVTETLIGLLLRLSEGGDRAYLPGGLAAPYFGRTFERLLQAGVLEELHPKDEWPVCSDCECGADARLVQILPDGALVAACPLDHRRDISLGADDLRVFRIDGRQLVDCIAQAIGRHVEVLPGLWRLTGTGGDEFFLALQRRAVEDPGVSATLRQAAQGPARILYCPKPGEEALYRLEQAGVQLIPLGDALTLSEAGGLVLSTDRPGGSGRGPRLTIYTTDEVVLVDGRTRKIPSQPFRLLRRLADAGDRGLTKTEIEAAFSGRAAKDLVRDLRRALGEGTLVATVTNPAAYRLLLKRQDVSVM